MKYEVQTTYDGQWSDEVGEPNVFGSVDEAEEAIAELKTLGDDWLQAEYRVKEIREEVRMINAGINVGIMVHCLACSTVVFAHDSGRWGDVRGLLNAFRLPCRLCGGWNEYKGYDGWTITADTMKAYGLPSVWMTMHRIAEENGLDWDNSPDLTWFSSSEARASVAEATGQKEEL